MANHQWKFFRAGGFDQVKLETGADLLALDQLDQKLWVALACPTTGLEFDPKTAALIDTDKDGRIRAPELIGALKWTGTVLKNADDLIKSSPTLPLASINDATAEGKAILASARQILSNLGKKDASAIGLDEVADTAKIFAQTLFNGDGVVPADSAADDATKAAISDIIACVGSVPDRSGKPGVNSDLVEKFFAEAAAYDAWITRSETEAASLLPLGAATADAAAAARAVKAKVDDYFGRCRLAGYDPRALGAVNRDEKEYAAIAAKDLQITAAEVAGFPLAQVAAGKPLPLGAGINPAWAGAVAAFVKAAVTPILGSRESLTEADWAAILGKLGPFECWSSGKAGASVEKLGKDRVRALLASKSKAAIADLLAKDKALESEANAISTVEKLIRFHRDLYTLATNFVNFKDLYDAGEAAIFQVGTLFLDQRSCTLCISVEDAGKHASMAGLAGAYLAYVDCVRKATGEKKSIVAIFSQGDDDNLMVGRNGLFYDRTGLDYDATITKIISNPISLRQAFWSPYKKFVRLIEEQVAKRAAAADADANAKLAAAAAATANADKTVAAPAAEKKIDVGAVAAMGVAFGAIGGFFTAVAAGAVQVVGMGPLAIIGAIIGLLALISGPSMILAYIKLRKRNLGPILDANGWAVNAAAKINVPFGTSLTGIAKLPPGSSIDRSDTYAEKAFPWKMWLAVILVAYGVFKYYRGDLDSGLPSVVQSTELLGKLSPKYVDPAKAAAASASTNAPAAVTEPAK
jgi:hypothetical protein